MEEDYDGEVLVGLLSMQFGRGYLDDAKEEERREVDSLVLVGIILHC